VHKMDKATRQAERAEIFAEEQAEFLINEQYE
jgi:hypothetical protein